MTGFSVLLNRLANNALRTPFLRNDYNQIKPVRSGLDHIQILYRPNHCTCSYYDTKKIYIYDSLVCSSSSILHNIQKKFLEKLYPHMAIDEKNILFATVQQQRRGSQNCGLFMVAFAVSVAYGIKPE